MSIAVRVDLVIDRGADWAAQIYWTDYTSAPFTVVAPMRMEIRNAAGALIVDLMTNTLEAEDVYPSINYNSETGLIQLHLTAAQTASIPEGQYRHDLFVSYDDTAMGGVIRVAKLIYGDVHVRGRVTQVV